MFNFEYKNPTKLIFGKNTLSLVKNEIPKNTKILLVYGGGSIKSNSIYSSIMNSLSEHEVIEFGGVSANPDYDYLLGALDIIRSEKIEYLLAVGGGSVIDATKFLASAALYKGENPWGILEKGIRTEIALPFGTILTLPATGSEMNSGAVISRRKTFQKLGMGGPGLFPQFSILDPIVIQSIPKHQLANGITDAFTHVLEQYMTYPVHALLQDRFAESILSTLIETAPVLIENPYYHEAASNFMWSCTMALNGLIQKGVPTDWAIHAMGHELTVFFGIDHARTLAIIAPSHYRYNFESKKEKLAQCAERVFGIHNGTQEEKANQCIERIESFFHTLGISTKLSEYTSEYIGTAEKIQERFVERGLTGIGEHKKITPADVRNIVAMAY